MTTIRLRRGTTAQWIAANPVLADGELGWDSTVTKFKMGNGTANWATLPYYLDTALAGKANTSHTHAATDMTSGTLPDARLAARLGTYAASITDWNLARTNGWYMGSSILNAPSTAWHIGSVEAHNDLYVTQTVHAFTLDGASNTYTFRRACNNGTWTGWDKLQLSQAEQDARYQQIIAAGTVAQFWRGDKTWQTLNATAVGLGNVNNTADSAKPISALQQTALNAKANKGERWANVTDYFDVGRVEGTTDDREAFELARLTLKPVYAPAGSYYFSRSPDWDNNTVLVGDGKGKTIFKLLDSAPGEANLIVNGRLNGTVQMYFADFTLDGNCYRQGGTLGTIGGSSGSTFTLRNVQYAYIDRVESISPIQHCFDVTRGDIQYPYVGDGNSATLRSSNIYFTECEGSDFGDDAFTTHSSDYVHFTKCVGFDPRNRGNCNAFEIDGDSQNCVLNDNRSYGCYSGVEIKGHGTESAARLTTINGHQDFGSVRSYSFRHIGYHTGADPISQSAEWINASNLVSIDPNNDKGFQDDATARSLSLNAFHGVNIDGFVSKGRGGYGAGDIAISAQYRCGEVNMNNVTISGWDGADYDLAVTTNGKVNLSNFTIRESAKNLFYIGSTVTGVNMSNFLATAPAVGANIGGELYNSTKVRTSNMQIEGYPTLWRADLTNYVSYEAFMRSKDRRSIVDLPSGITRLVDLDPTQDYYGTSGAMATITDAAGLGGANIIQHSKIASDVYIQTVTRNTTGPTIQGKAWRIVYTDLTAGPWNRDSTNEVIDTPAGLTRLVDLDLSRSYYASSGAMGTVTDGPGLGGALFVEHDRVSSDGVIQTVTRNTTGTTIQGRAWRIIYPSNLSSGPWNRVVLASDVSVSDTGFRNIGTGFTNGWTGNAEDVILARDGNIVTFSAKVNSTSATADGFILLPDGFRPEATDWMALACYNSVGTGRWGRVYPDGVVSCSRPAPLGWHYLSGSWKTSDAWPATLPGAVRTQ